ncbi:helix-turn-helix domain-containing protein [Amnibacterium flavum]|uniref:AraC family transcriptional regulator n=1 Tax=Amnibacterium flavum TaxID=2173173 RepID=A0A2V1HVW5_9MICO|nr:AraC family transcriptional regulator [Amnibacterium flavum]PVZ95200.1 AraC family transcriptional regulator [Amnibacterium flavum]
METVKSAGRAEQLLNRAAELEVIVRHPERSVVWLEHDFPAPIARWNYHPEYEIHLIRHGAGRFIVGDHIGAFGPGHVTLVGAGLPHHWLSDLAPGEVLRKRDAVIQFDRAWLERASVEMPELRELRPLLDQSSRGIEFHGRTAVEAAEAIEAMGATDHLLRLIHFFRVLGILSRSPKEDRVVLARDWFTPPGAASPAAGAVERSLGYIFDNLAGTVRMAEAARLAGMSQPTFSRFFQRASGRTFSEMVRMLRIARARVLLEESDAPIAGICYDVGYSNLSNFNRQFLREVGMTPRAYRRSVGSRQ